MNTTEAQNTIADAQAIIRAAELLKRQEEEDGTAVPPGLVSELLLASVRLLDTIG